MHIFYWENSEGEVSYTEIEKDAKAPYFELEKDELPDRAYRNAWRVDSEGLLSLDSTVKEAIDLENASN